MAAEPQERTEYGVQYSGGSILIRPAEGDSYWPNEQWAATLRASGNKVMVRRVLVLSDWEETE